MSPYASQSVVEVIPPRGNRGDVLSAEMLLSSLMSEDLFSLEVSGDANGPHLLIRGMSSTVRHVRNQLRTAYSRVEFRELSLQDDPARNDGRSRVTAELVLEHSSGFPLRNFEEGTFETADPIRGLLGALKGLGRNERVASQLVLSPASSDWARKYLSLAQPPQPYAARETTSVGLEFQHGIGCTWVLGTAALSLIALYNFGYRHWLEFAMWATVAGLFFSGAGWVWTKLARPTINPKLVEQKVSRPAYQVWLRLYAYADTRDRAMQLVKRISGAYQQFGMTYSNTFKPQLCEFDPQFVEMKPSSWVQELLDKVMRLNVTELAALWHLPAGEALQQVEHTMARRLLPIRPYSFARGILIGHAESQGERIPIHLAPGMLEHNTFMIAKTQKGKSTLMAHLAAAAMQENMALVVIDPHGSLARNVSGLVPRHRVKDVRYLDWGDRQRAVGFNFLDVQQGCDERVIVSNIVHAGSGFWEENWGPRMEDALRYALRVLLEANGKLAARGQDQFTMLDVNFLFRYPNFRRRLIKEYVRDEETISWWKDYYENLPANLRMEVTTPVTTKMDRLAENMTLRNIIGQSRSTINFRDVLSERGIVLIDTANGVIGDDAAGLLMALFLDSLNYAIRNQVSISNAAERPHVMVVVDELQKLEGVDYGSFLAELRKMGGSFVMGTQSLAQLEPDKPKADAGVLSNIDTLIVFDTYAADAEVLTRYLDELVDTTDIINLPDHTAYIKTQADSEPLPAVFVKLLTPAFANDQIQGEIDSQVVRYTMPPVEQERRRQLFETQWVGRDRNMRDSDSDKQEDSSQQNQSGANAVGYDPKSPIRSNGPAPFSTGTQSAEARKPKPGDKPVQAPLGLKKPKEWGKP